MRSLSALVAVIAFLPALLTVPSPAVSGTGMAEDEEARVFRDQIAAAAQGSGIPGLVFALKERGGRVFIGSVGTADAARGIPMRVDSRFYIGTISQSMLAAVVLMLADEGRLGLGDPVSRFVPFPGGESVSVEMLLDHSSGFADWTGGDLAATGNPQLPGLLKAPQTADALLRIAASGKPVFSPGQRQEASYTNMLLLTKLIERVEHRSPSSVLEERIFKPLGMTETGYLKTGERAEGLAAGYRGEKGWGPSLRGGLAEAGWADDSLRALADQGMVSTAGDVLKYHVGLREGKLLSPRSWARMHGPRQGKINGLGYLILRSSRGTWEGNTGHAVGHLSISLFHVEEGFYLVVMGNLGDTGLPVAKWYDIRHGKQGREKPES